MWNLPNILTMLRIVLIPIFVVVFYVEEPWASYGAAAVFGAAALTDWLDGYLARRLNQTTPFGAFLDPVADKLIVVTALVLLVGHHSDLWLTLPAIIIVGREIVVSALREWMADPRGKAVFGSYYRTMEANARKKFEGVDGEEGRYATDGALGMDIMEMFNEMPIVSELLFQKEAWDKHPEEIVADLLAQVHRQDS